MTCLKLLELHWNHLSEEHTSFSHPVCWELRWFDMSSPHHPLIYSFRWFTFISMEALRKVGHNLFSIFHQQFNFQSSISRTLSWPSRSSKNVNSSSINFFLTFAFIGSIVKRIWLKCLYVLCAYNFIPSFGLLN